MEDAPPSQGGRGRGRRALATAAIAAASLSLAASAAAHGSLRAAGARPRLVIQGDAFGPGAGNVAPGDSLERRLRVSNEGSAPAEVVLSARVLGERAGAAGGLLSRRLTLGVRRSGARSSSFDGPLTAMPALDLGRLAPGATRSYTVQLDFAAAGDAYQGGRLRVAFTWTAVAAP
jgi:hypothetical protein